MFGLSSQDNLWSGNDLNSLSSSSLLSGLGSSSGLGGLDSLGSLGGLGSSGASQSTAGMDSGAFQLVLIQMLTRLLERLEKMPSAASTSATPSTTSGYTRIDYDIAPTAVATPAAASAAARQAYAPAGVTGASAPAAASEITRLAAFPRPAADNGRGMHWIPTTSSSPEVVDRYVQAMKDMHIKWVTFLNDGAQTGDNDYLVQQLKANGMEPVMRVYTPGLQPVSGDLGALVRHYRELGVSYFQLYNEPNQAVENDGQTPDVKRYLDLWAPAAQTIIDNGGLPGFGGLSQADPTSDTAFLSQSIDELRARGQIGLLQKSWLSMHNYQGDLPLESTDGFMRFKTYADILRQKLGYVLPMIGTEGGTFAANPADEARRTAQVTQAYQYMAQREPYNFAYSYWVVANQAGGGHDPAWENQALYQADGHSPLVDALETLE